MREFIGLPTTEETRMAAQDVPWDKVINHKVEQAADHTRALFFGVFMAGACLEATGIKLDPTINATLAHLIDPTLYTLGSGYAAYTGIRTYTMARSLSTARQYYMELKQMVKESYTSAGLADVNRSKAGDIVGKPWYLHVAKAILFPQ